MEKEHYLFIVFIVLAFNIQAQYRVQVAAFLSPVEDTYFSDKEIKGVFMRTDQNQIYRYYIGDFVSYKDAEERLAVVKEKGFPSAQLIDIEEERALCAAPCPYVSPTSTFVDEYTDALYLRSIFFDFDKSSLKNESVQQLNILHEVLNNNPGYKVQALAHTDAKGSAEYNIALSKRRARSARNYLIAKGIASYRIETKVYGESKPIALNEVAGRDTPEGRKYNRRVVLVVTDANGRVIPEVVKPIEVPLSLKASRI